MASQLTNCICEHLSGISRVVSGEQFRLSSDFDLPCVPHAFRLMLDLSYAYQWYMSVSEFNEPDLISNGS